MIQIIISHINLLLSLVNDILDLNLLEEDKYMPKENIFNP